MDCQAWRRLNRAKPRQDYLRSADEDGRKDVLRCEYGPCPFLETSFLRMNNAAAIGPSTCVFGSRRSRLILAGIVLLFLVVRVPLIYRQAGGQDEHLFAVPGWTVAREGVPRIPYVPGRDPASVFYRADEALFALPPAYFYWQALFFLVLPAGYGTARLASVVAGLIAVVLVYLLGRKLYANEAVGLWAAGLYALSRPFIFPATCARPDMFCGMLGLWAILVAWQWYSSRRTRWLVGAGALAGLGLLAHPFAIVYCLQLGVWTLLTGPGLRGRLTSAVIFAGSALAVFALWIPLILAYPDAFRGQFFTNVLDRTGPGLLSRLLCPWPAVVHRAGELAEYFQGPQLCLMLTGLVLGTVLDWRRLEAGPRTALALAWSSIYLLFAAAGAHPTNGYWCYPAALVFLLVARTVVAAGRRLTQDASRPGIIVAYVGGGLLVVSMLPGAGLRAWVAHLQHWSDPNYNAPTFVRRVFCDFPPDTRLAVDMSFAFDVYLTGRPVVWACTAEFYFDMSDFPNDYLIVGAHGQSERNTERLGATLLRSYGDPGDPFACWAEVYQLKRQQETASSSDATGERFAPSRSVQHGEAR
jgi:hypothetical protein